MRILTREQLLKEPSGTVYRDPEWMPYDWGKKWLKKFTN